MGSLHRKYFSAFSGPGVILLICARVQLSVVESKKVCETDVDEIKFGHEWWVSVCAYWPGNERDEEERECLQSF